VGMSIVVPKESADEAVRILNACGEDAYVIGEITEGETKIVLR
ncbi:MAG: phosphoribosylformylglycinamidine cyclo-ligase, partial [Lachnospiraceae bacterium]|nr:phosphoribosylformylglycinamidine cyclo-ligase [Lachnospiraceae bacterium]